ncbi:response regulator [Methylomicrobium sp. RS1]|nr:response regulator [Methylomicrobium sp. RS1]
MQANNSRILVVDDEPNVLRSISRLLKDYQVTSFLNGEEALAAALKMPFDLVISDYQMPGMNGVEFLTFFKAIQPDTVRMILTAYADLNSIQHAINEAEIFRFINKPWNPVELINAVTRGLEHKHILMENKTLADEVRRQRLLLEQKEAILNALEAEEPGITKVKWTEDGSIIINSSNYD